MFAFEVVAYRDNAVLFVCDIRAPIWFCDLQILHSRDVVKWKLFLIAILAQPLLKL